ncbi:MAG: response regulator [Bacteroidetes bacterium]|nr:response regulator [Bacteroidota bacterium]MCL5737215.1 response regulator [Bacteroidota bacterium]
MESNNILLVEDDQQSALVYKDILETEGYKVEWASTATEAREILFAKRTPKQAVIIDLHIPEKKSTLADTAHGAALVKEVKTNLGSQFPIVVISGVRSKKVMIEEGLSDFRNFEIIEKPIGGTIIQTLRKIIPEGKK